MEPLTFRCIVSTIANFVFWALDFSSFSKFLCYNKHMPPKFGANLGPNEGTTDSGADTFDANDGATQDNMVASNNISTPSSVATPANTSTDISNTATDQPVSGMSAQNPFANKVIASDPDSHPAHTQASGSGDIILHNSQPKDNKKIFIVAGIIGLIIVAFVIIISFLLGSSKKSSGIATAEEQFNQYANYVLYGETGTTLEGEYDREVSYKISEQFYSDNYDENFWQAAEEKLALAIKQYEATKEEEKDQALTAYLKDYQTNFKFVLSQKTTVEPTEMQIAERFLTDGVNDTRQFLDQTYGFDGEIADGTESQIPDNSDIDGEEVASDDIDTVYRKAKWTMLKAQLESYELYNRYGCLHGDYVDAVCSNMDDEAVLRVNNLQDIILDSKATASQIIAEAINYLIMDCWTISEWYQTEENLEVYEEQSE